MQPKRACQSVLFFSLLIALTGCGTEPPAKTPRSFPFEGQTLSVATPSPTLTTLVERYSTAWRAREKAANVTVRTIEPHDETASTDLWVIPATALPTWVNADRIDALPESIREATEDNVGWMGLLPLYRNHFLVWGRDKENRLVAYGLPILGEAPLCFYRTKGWLSDDTHRSAFEKKYNRELQPPATWEEYRQVAEYFFEAKAKQPSLPALPSDDLELVHLFNRIAAGYVHRAVASDETLDPGEIETAIQHYFDLATGDPRIDSAGFVHTLTLMQQLQGFRPTKAVAEPATRFLEGDAVLCLADARWIGTFQDAQRGHIRDEFGIQEVPGADRYFVDDKSVGRPGGNMVPYLGAHAWVGVMRKGADHPEAALSLLKELASKHISGEIVREPRWGGGVIRGDQLEQQVRWDSFDLDPSHTASLKRALSNTLQHPRLQNPVYALRIPRANDFQAVLGKALRKALEENRDASQALGEVRQAWQKLIDEQGKAKHLADVRTSFGFYSK